ncbi:MAG: hypothetical protein FJZ90_03360 [Chloroflexi bacterium]|nr:hypothetical protein [Chloroflexota bacterium]
MRKSCLAELVVLALLAIIVGSVIRRALVPATPTMPPGQVTAVVVSSAEGSTTPPRGLSLRSLIAGAATEPEATPTPALADEALPTGIEGLALRISQPLMLAAPEVTGLAMTERFLYVAGHNPETQNALLFQLDRETKTIRQVRTIAHGSQHVSGGLHAGGGYIWGCLRGMDASEGTIVLALDETYLEVRQQFTVPERLAAVAWVDQGRICGVDASGAWMYCWSPDGREMTRASLGSGARYGDMEVIGGSLVCAGYDEFGGVLDVYDPNSLTLLVRHRGAARSQGGDWVTGRGFAYWDGLFYFLPDGGSLPMLLSYALDGVPLQDYVPAMQ